MWWIRFEIACNIPFENGHDHFSSSLVDQNLEYYGLESLSVFLRQQTWIRGTTLVADCFQCNRFDNGVLLCSDGSTSHWHAGCWKSAWFKTTTEFVTHGKVTTFADQLLLTRVRWFFQHEKLLVEEHCLLILSYRSHNHLQFKKWLVFIRVTWNRWTCSNHKLPLCW